MKKIAAASGPIINDMIYLNGDSQKGVIGGAGLYATQGMSAVFGSAVFMGHAGADFNERYGEFLRCNNIENAVVQSMENTLYEILKYNNDGSYGVFYKYKEHEKKDIYNDINPSFDEIEAIAAELSGLYVIKRPDDIDFLEGVASITKKHNIKTIYEYSQGFFNSYVGAFEKILKAASLFSIFTINKNEISKVLGNDDDEYILKKLKEIDCELIFYRVGDRGAYIISGDDCFFIPAILADIEKPEPTGCGNCSTGAVLASFILGDDPQTIGIKANIAAYLNVLQVGPFIDKDGNIQEVLNRAAKKYKEELQSGVEGFFSKKLIKPTSFWDEFLIK